MSAHIQHMGSVYNVRMNVESGVLNDLLKHTSDCWVITGACIHLFAWQHHGDGLACHMQKHLWQMTMSPWLCVPASMEPELLLPDLHQWPRIACCARFAEACRKGFLSACSDQLAVCSPVTVV